LALKNTPLAFLTAYSYEWLNILHQAAGYCTVLFAMLHAVLYITTNTKLGSLSDFLEPEQIMGIVAGFAMLFMLTTALTLRRIRYEAFYIVHIVMFMLVIIAVGMHGPEFQMKAIYIIIFSACIWGSDRLLLGLRMVVHAFGNCAHAYPLPQGGIRIVMRRTPWRSVPGTHVFLWIPKVRAMETHPFTILSTSPLEVVISSQDGFTRDLFSLVSKRPGALLIASCDGPYGTLPDFAKFKHVVLVAGGSGATFTIGVALNLIHKLPSSGGKPLIHFIWVIQDHGKIPNNSS
jgi:predicted ferric reductase